MGCSIKVTAPDGSPSVLFAKLAVIYGDDAMGKYLDIMSNKSRYKLDSNGEPSIQSVASFHSQDSLFAPVSSATTNSGGFGPDITEKRFDAVIGIKKRNIKRLNSWIAEQKDALTQLEQKGNPADLPKIRAYYKSIHDLTDRVERTQEEVDQLVNAGTQNAPAEFLFRAIFSGNVNSIASRDMERIRKLVNSNEVRDLKEAADLIDLYSHIGNFAEAAEIGHILFTENEIVNRATGQLRLRDSYRKPFEAIAAEALASNGKLKTKLQNVLVNVARNNRLIQETLKRRGRDPLAQPLNFEELTKAAPDVNALVANFLDPTAGNPELAQLMVSLIHEENEKAWSEAKELIDRINTVVQDAEAELRRMGEVGVGGIGVKFDIFKQKYVRPIKGEERETGHLITRYSANFEAAKRYLVTGFREAMEEAATSPRRKQLIKDAYKKRNRWYKSNLILVDPNRIASIVNDRKYVSLSKGPSYAPAEMQAHEDELVRHLGSREALDDIIHKSRKQLNQYLIHRDIVIEQISTQPPASRQNPVPFQNWTVEMRQKLEFWELANNPFLIPEQDSFVSLRKYQPNGEYIRPAYERFAVSIPRRFKADVRVVNGMYVVKDHPSGEKTIWYDPNFEKIENNKPLYDFYKTMIDTIETVNRTLPPDLQRNMRNNSLIAIQKSVLEGFISDGGNYLEALGTIGASGVKFMDFVRNTVTQDRADTPKPEYNPITGEMEQSVNSAFLGNRDREVEELKKIMDLRWEQQNGGQKIPLSQRQIHERLAQDQVAKKYSFDVTKILQMYAVLGLQYAHRERILPVMKILKDHYKDIQKPYQQTGIFTVLRRGKNTVDNVESMRRTQANLQIEDWFKRAVLGDYTNFDEGKTKKRIYKSKEAKQKAKEIQELIDNESDPNKVEELETMLEDQMSNVTGSGTIDLLLHALRLKGMGWNLPAVPMNIMAGTVANLGLASDGRVVSWQSIWRAYRIVLGNMMKALTFGKVSTEEARKNTILMDKYKVLQDATNEFQKAGQSSKITSKFDPLNPYEPVTRGEFINQSTIMMGLLMDTKITGIDGTVSSVWDALKEDGTLKDNFNTTQHNEDWVLMRGENYNNFKVKLNKAIVVTHGDYDTLRGMKAKRSILGRMATMFRTWLPRAYYTRFGGEQEDIELGHITKGRYRSYTPASGLIAGASMGTILVPGIGTVVGGALGYGAAAFTGVKAGTFGEDLMFTTKQLLRKLAGKSTQFDDKFSEVDAANLRANLTELVMLMSMFTAYLMTKMFLWDDDDERDDPKRKAHNLLANYTMRMMGDVMMFTSPMGFNELQSNILPIASMIGRTARVMDYFMKMLNGEHIIPTGYNAGENGFINAVEDAFIPNAFVGIMELDPTLGYDKITKRQFKTTRWDKMFYSEERKQKNQRQRENAKKRKEKREAENQPWWKAGE